MDVPKGSHKMPDGSIMLDSAMEDPPTSGKVKNKRRAKRARSKRQRKLKVKRKVKRKQQMKRQPRARQPPPVINIDNTTYWPIGNEEGIPQRPRAPRRTGPAGQRALEAREIKIVHQYEAMHDAPPAAHVAAPQAPPESQDNADVRITDPPTRPTNSDWRGGAAAAGVSASTQQRLAQMENSWSQYAEAVRSVP